MPESEEEKKAREAKEAADAAAKAAVDAAAKAAPFATFPDAESFKTRVAREARAMLKEAGLTETDPVKLKAIVDQYAQVQAANAAAEEAKKSEIQKAAEAKAASDLAAQQAMTAAEEAEMKAHLYRTFAEQGVKNFDYAFFKVQSELAKLGDGQELDEVKYIQGLLADPTQQAALGVVAAAVVKVEGVTNTEAGKQPDPVPGSPAGDPQKPGDAFTQSKEAFSAGVAAKYGFTPPIG